MGSVWWRCMRSNRTILSLVAEHAYFHAEEDEEVCCWPPREWVKRDHARGGRVENPRWMRKVAKKFNQFVVTATDGFGLEQCPEKIRNDVDLPRRFLRVREQRRVGMAPGQSWRAA